MTQSQGRFWRMMCLIGCLVQLFLMEELYSWHKIANGWRTTTEQCREALVSLEEGVAYHLAVSHPDEPMSERPIIERNHFEGEKK